jgi:hypothetical protein
VPVSCCKQTNSTECLAAVRNLELADLPLAAINNDVSHIFSWDRCYDFLNIFAENFSENIGVFCSNYY